MTLHMSLYVVTGYKTFTTQSTVTWLLHRMTLHVFLQVVAAQSTMICNLHSMTFHVCCLVITEVSSDHFIRKESSLPPKCLQQGQDPIGYCWPLSAYSVHQESSLSPPWRLQQGQGHVG